MDATCHRVVDSYRMTYKRNRESLVKADFSDVLRQVHPLALKDSWDNEQRRRIPRRLHPVAQEKAE